MPFFSRSFLLPHSAAPEESCAVIPRPESSSRLSAGSAEIPRFDASSTMLLAIGCVELASHETAMERSSSSLMSEAVIICCTTKFPLVIVPVLSITTALTFLSASMESPPLNSIPSFEAAPIPEKNASGTLITSAQGQLITRKVIAVSIQKLQFPLTTEGMIAVISASITTIGVYILANFVMNLSILGFPAAAFSTESRMRVTMDSERGFSTLILISPCSLTQPEMTSVPGCADTGTGSPVTGEVSIRLSPSVITPSRGILSPGRTSRISPTPAFSAGIVCTWSPWTRFTVSGRISTASMI